MTILDLDFRLRIADTWPLRLLESHAQPAGQFRLVQFALSQVMDQRWQADSSEANTN